MKTSAEGVVNKIANLLEPQYIYLYRVETGSEEKILLVTLLRDDAGDRSNLAITAANILHQHTGHMIRFYTLAYAEQQLRNGSIFFMLSCRPENCAYSHPGQPFPVLAQGLDMDKALASAKSRFHIELATVMAFRDGVAFFREKGNTGQAAFMLHQSVELGYRLAELLLMGKEKICHLIGAHQKYIAPFSRELGMLFDPENPEELAWLELLEKAYKGVRYSHDYHISPEQLDQIADRCNRMPHIIEKLFESLLQKWKDSVPGETGGNTGDEEDGEPAGESGRTGNPPDFEHIRNEIECYIGKRLCRSEYDRRKLYYKTDFLTDGPTDMLMNMSSLIKVCIMALEQADSGYSKLIPQPHINVQTVLEFVLQLMPYDEIKCLEGILENYGGAHIPVC